VEIPGWFEDQLKRDFRDRYLIRWSEAKHCFMIMERQIRGLAYRPARLATKLQNLSEANREEFLYRLRTGTSIFVEIYPQGRAVCPRCEAKVDLDRQVWAFAHCPWCDKDFKAVSYDLGNLLLEQLRYLDFDRGGDERILKDMDEANENKVRVDKRDDRNVLEAGVKEDWRQVVMKSPMVGFNKVYRGENDGR
jgi:uncharacterized Zn-finger protein